jgi:predicted O-methyltransferase YrrM
MSLHHLRFILARKLRRLMGMPEPHPTMADFAIDASRGPELAKTIDGEIARLFFATEGHLVHKWLHYLEAYQRYFAPYKNGPPVRMLEIGVSKGGSLDLWRRYFGPEATIYGIDINPACANVATPPNQVRIGSQADPAFLKSVIDEMGAPDLILDDGSHVAGHQAVSFNVLFPLLKEGGLYAIEDIQTAYWPAVYDGGYRRQGTVIELVKTMIDDMHAWYHRHPTTTPAKDQIGAIHIHDSVIFIEKRRRDRPGHIRMGQDV